MKKSLLTLILSGLIATLSIAAESHTAAERQADVTRHRAMAAAHEAAAKCLESAKSEQACEQALQSACRGLAIGKLCGMKHAH